MPPDKLENHLQKATWESMQKLLGASAAQFQSLKPAMVATGLMIGVVAQQGYDPAGHRPALHQKGKKDVQATGGIRKSGISGAYAGWPE
jgi:hypothetical protein